MLQRIMLIDDEPFILNALNRLLRRHSNWEIEIFDAPENALRRATTSIFDLFLSDYRMPSMDGVAFLKQVKQLQPESIRILLTGHADVNFIMAAINEAEIFRFICKPWNDHELYTNVQQALELRAYREENRRFAELIREQKSELERRKSALELLEEQHPGITKVNWAPDGSIILE